MTPDSMRELFEKSGLTYRDVDETDILALQGFLLIEYARHDRTSWIHLRTDYRKKFEPSVTPHADGGIQSAFLLVGGGYFHGREAISFNEDGYIGFAGWADGKNIIPFLKAFKRWVEEWMLGSEER